MLTHDKCKPYQKVWSDLIVEQNCILKGARLVVPKCLRKLVLQEIHSDQVVRFKAIVRSFVWWLGMDKDIDEYVKGCGECAVQQNNPPVVCQHRWECPKFAWQRLHIDFAGPFLDHSYLIIVDAYSKWPEVVPMKLTTSCATIKALMQMFATHGLTERLVSDNGPQFTSQEFKDLLKINGIQHVLSTPYHPSTNGEAEKSVQTFKHNMKCRGATAMLCPASVNFCLRTGQPLMPQQK
ncbi:uncharacterized protein K02A2.6-like [Scylla paramamosain]|uniref:uncharacterized protein K02A2.6-like n=1 Tax=Scylla paramamosain TaxID=85552 RepID=UPI003082F4D6